MKLVAIVVPVLLGVASVGSAAPAPTTFAVRAGVALEAPHQTIDLGWTLGASVDWPRRFGDAGLAGEWAHDGDGPLGAIDMAVLGAFARVSPTARGPFLEVGLGAGYLHRAGTDQNRSYAADAVNAAAWVGVGAPLPFPRSPGARLDTRYVVVLTQAPGLYGGGGVEDAFTVGVSLAFGRRAAGRR